MLSRKEAKSYLKSYSESKCQGTKYAIDKELWVDSNSNCSWWLLSPSNYGVTSACHIDSNGFDLDNSVDDLIIGMRAVCWIKL